MINDRIKDFTRMQVRDQITELAVLVDRLCTTNALQSIAVRGVNENIQLLTATVGALSKRIPSLTDEQVELIKEDEEARHPLKTIDVAGNIVDDTEIQIDGDNIDDAVNTSINDNGNEDIILIQNELNSAMQDYGFSDTDKETNSAQKDINDADDDSSNANIANGAID